MSLELILRDSSYSLDLFTLAEIRELSGRITIREVRGKKVFFVKCLIREREVVLKPEEVIRQLFLRQLITTYGYPKSCIAVEFSVSFGVETKRADIVILDADYPDSAYVIVELKKPKLLEAKGQLRSYCNGTGAPIGIWTNGRQISFYHRKDPNFFEEIPNLPKAQETLADVLSKPFTIADLEEKFAETSSQKSLVTRILEMEEEVLANAGVDVFEECFKLIFTKLYDELEGYRDRARNLEFRNTGLTDAQLYARIDALFTKAKAKWEGIFPDGERINLSRSHLAICVGSLEDYKLFNSNLEVIDDAFEYLVAKDARQEKGQFFTPRYVIDMCVKMLDPKEYEYVIDTAAGSSGFTVHSIFHVWKKIYAELGLDDDAMFTGRTKPVRCVDYVREKVFALDFDKKSVRVGRTLNLIAGDGQTNYLHLNTLDYDRWGDITAIDSWSDIYHEGFKKLKRLRNGNGSYQKFKFDILMANPPFAGEVKESRLISKYELGHKPNGRLESKIGRDILFIERNLDFLKPGGRMAVVLPQGRYNNSSDKRIREYIAERCRILAVVGLHGNTFKPHTGTKTSVLFVQKWNDDANSDHYCPKTEDYNIFFATQSSRGKDNSGRKLLAVRDGKVLKDGHGHALIDHDLHSHDGITNEGIAEAFQHFAYKEKLSFSSDFFA